MGEREPRKEIIGRGELFFLCHPGTEDTFSGYGLTVQPGDKDILVGLLMIDRPGPADPGQCNAARGNGVTIGSTCEAALTAKKKSGCGIGFELVGVLLPLLWVYSRRRHSAA